MLFFLNGFFFFVCFRYNRTSFVTEFDLYFNWIFLCWVSRVIYSFFQPLSDSRFYFGFKRWVMHRTGEYKMLNMIFGILPFFAAILMTQMKEDSHPAHLWLSIVKKKKNVHFPQYWCSLVLDVQMPLGFGNAVVLQTMFSKS